MADAAVTFTSLVSTGVDSVSTIGYSVPIDADTTEAPDMTEASFTDKTLTDAEFTDLLIAEGYDRDDAVSVIDQLIDAGLEIPADQQPEDGYVLTYGELSVARDQLDA